MKIQINTLCCQYWRRFFWCLSSIVEQVKPIPNIKLRINTCIDWMLWFDPDQVINPMHFNYLFNNLEELGKKNKILSLIRRDISVKNSTAIINKYTYRKPVENCFNKFAGLSAIRTRGMPGIGYYQLVSTKLLQEKGINRYSDFKRDRGMWNRVNYIYTTISDMIFRKKIGAIKINGIPGILHLEHPRLKERLKYFEKDSL